MPPLAFVVVTVAPRQAARQWYTMSKALGVNAEYVVADQCKIPDTVLLDGKTVVLIAGVEEPAVHVVLSDNGAVGPLLQTTSDLSSSVTLC